MGLSGQSIEEVYSRRVRHKLATILNDSTHPLYSDFDNSCMEGSGRLQVTLARTNRLKFSFLPSAISTFNRRFEHKYYDSSTRLCVCVCVCVCVCARARACVRACACA